jgi:phosphoglycolate phosphatase-like HAD superfamily hydrolase
LPEGFLLAPAMALERLVAAETLLLDMDDTVYKYKVPFEQGIKRAALVALAPRLPQEATRTTLEIIDASDTLVSPKPMIARHLGQAGVLAYYSLCDELLEETTTADDIAFDPGAIALVTDAAKKGIEMGAISNNAAANGMRVLKFFSQETGVDLRDRAVFLSSSGLAKPDPKVLDYYVERTGMHVQPEVTAYIGDIAEDVAFADNIGALGVLHDATIEASEAAQRVPANHIVVSHLSDLHRHLANAW